MLKKLSLLLILPFLLNACAKKPENTTSYSDRNREIVYDSLAPTRDYKSNYNVSANWKYAKSMQAEGRYEIAREYLLIALASAQTIEEQNWIEREIFAIDLQIKSKR